MRTFMRHGLVIILVVVVLVGCRDRAKPPPEAATAPASAHSVSAENIEKSLESAQEYITSNDLPKAQAILLQRMGLRLPERIRIAEDDLTRASKM